MNNNQPSSIRLRASADIDAPAEFVWTVVSDYSLDVQWRSGVVSMTSSPSGPVSAAGVSTAEVIRVAGRTYHNDGVVRSVDPGRAFTWQTTSGATANGSRAVDHRPDGGCTVTLSLDVQPTGFDRLLAPVVRRVLARNLRGDIRRLRELVERLGAASSPLADAGTTTDA